ncbi:MAG: nickel transporter [Nitrospirae bacterium]|nr:nickel transporter [Nitrospirota bacterium]
MAIGADGAGNGMVMSPVFSHGTGAASLLLVLLALGTGVRHGLDPDHLTAIDAILRFQSARKRRVVKWAGLYFSLGHGIVVMGLGTLIIGLALHVRVPFSLEVLGGLISGLFLLGMAGVNGLFLARTEGDVPFAPAGFRARKLLRGWPLDRPLFLAGLGMLFAVSFDTVSQTVVFSLAASSLGGLGEGMAMGLAFVLGMSLSDGANGLWIARLIDRSDLRGIRLSRTMGWAVVALSLFVGLMVLAKAFFPEILPDSPISETLTGAGVILVLSLTFLFAGRLSRDTRS